MDSLRPICLLLLVSVGAYSLVEREMMRNRDFEEDLDKDWKCFTACDISHSQDSYSGLYSGMVVNRKSKTSTPRQTIQLDQPGGTYYFTARMKLLNEFVEDYPLGHMVELAVSYSTNGKKNRNTIAKIPRVRMSDGWVQIGGDFRLPDDCDKLSLYAFASDTADINYLLDSCSIVRFEEEGSTVEEQNAMIEQIRKGNLEIVLVTPKPNDYAKVKLQLDQTKHAFPFGSAITAPRLYKTNDPLNEAYRDYFFDNFNWATLANAMKWRYMESNEHKPSFYTIHKALEILKEKEVPVRGHCISWAKKQKVIQWLKNKDAEEVKKAVIERITYLVREFNYSTIRHWDVLNEDLHGTWYEEITHNPQFLQAMFNEMHLLQPEIQLFTNDYDALSHSLYTAAYRNLCMKLCMNGVPISAIGLQSHLSVEPDVTLLKKRLDVMAEANLPLWITELDVRNINMKLRAQGYEDVLRLYFSHPAVHGIIIWGFWDQDVGEPTASLVEGADFVENLAGERVRHLLHSEWHTAETHVPSSAIDVITSKAFYGTYNLTLSYDNDIIWNGAVEHLAGEKKRLIITVNSTAPADQIFRVSS